MSTVYLHKAGRPDDELGQVKMNGKVYRSKFGPDPQVGHVDTDSGKIFRRRIGPDEYIGRVDLHNGKVYRHVPLGADEYLGEVHADGRMYRQASLAADDYMGRMPDFISYAHSGAAFLLLVLPAYEAAEQDSGEAVIE